RVHVLRLRVHGHRAGQVRRQAFEAEERRVSDLIPEARRVVPAGGGSEGGSVAGRGVREARWCRVHQEGGLAGGLLGARSKTKTPLTASREGRERKSGEAIRCI